MTRSCFLLLPLLSLVVLASCGDKGEPAARDDVGDEHDSGSADDDGSDDDGSDGDDALTEKTTISVSGCTACWLTDGGPVCESDLEPYLGVPSVPLETLHVGELHACGVEANGTPHCWGWAEGNDGSYWGMWVPPGPVMDIAPGYVLTWWLDASGMTDTADGYGDPETWDHCEAPNCAVPGGPYAAIDADDWGACTLSTEGEVVCVGYFDGASVLQDAPAGAFHLVRISRDDACALATDGSISCWGRHASLVDDAPEGSFADVAVGDGFACALDADGEASCWGEALPADLPDASLAFVDLDADDGWICGISADYEVLCWGEPECP